MKQVLPPPPLPPLPKLCTPGDSQVLLEDPLALVDQAHQLLPVQGEGWGGVREREEEGGGEEEGEGRRKEEEGGGEKEGKRRKV